VRNDLLWQIVKINKLFKKVKTKVKVSKKKGKKQKNATKQHKKFNNSNI